MIKIHILIIIMTIAVSCADVYALDCSFFYRSNTYSQDSCQNLGQSSIYLNFKNQHDQFFEALYAKGMSSHAYKLEEAASNVLDSIDMDTKGPKCSVANTFLLMTNSDQRYQTQLPFVDGSDSSNYITIIDGANAAFNAPTQAFYAIIGACIIALPLVRRMKKRI